ncbi:PadR family transcriptional regulator [Microlunatus phosphovorus]|nr:helix-turn-helix transcriptional regulator [Microlunatus phosphovorus]
MPTAKALTSTSYAILGLLAVKPWTTYELAKQVDQTLSRFWPRTRSKLFEEPKKLAAAGLAEATASATGRRRSTVYSITPAGRTALARWLTQESVPPLFESEHLLKVFYAENGTTEDVRATLAGLRSWVVEQSRPNVEVGSRYLAGVGAHPERLATLVLTGRFLDDYLELLDRWAAWAEEVVAQWPDDPAAAQPDLASLQATVEQARERVERAAG